MATNIRPQQVLDLKQIKRLTKEAKKKRVNRCYSEKCFNISDIRLAGLIQSEKITQFDQVVLEKSQNELIDYFGFDQQGSYLRINLSIVSLYPDTRSYSDESNWRLARVKFNLFNAATQSSYHYETEQLIDYDSKRRQSSSHEAKNIYKIGSLSLEIINPHSLSRFLFNGSLKCCKNGEEKMISTRISISTHPTCDKFDHQYRFSSDYLARIIQKCEPANASDVKECIQLVLANRIDQTYMFHILIEQMDKSLENQIDCMMVWGSRSKRFMNPHQILTSESSEPKESLLLWVECGDVIQLNRPSGKHLNLVYGWVHNNYDYAGFFNDIKLMRCEDGDKLIEVEFEELKSFKDLQVEPQRYQIHITSFRSKLYTIKFGDTNNSMVRAEVNGFQGWALINDENESELIGSAQVDLWSLIIGDEKCAYKLASEQLLGGKGNSLVELSKSLQILERNLGLDISVPSGLVVSCVAYELWFKSNSLIANSIDELDRTRRALAARSIFTNPLDDDNYLTLAQSQQIMREQCQKTCLLLKSCPLPSALKKHLYSKLSKIFTEDHLKGSQASDTNGSGNGKVFAVRSSAVGEDSIETSAAGQMRTILDVVGFESICSAIVECWSSQFELEAVTYKTQNGLDFNLPMAVVVQELIHCKMAGVAATCDPLNGNNQELQILANLGLGEGVVSGKQTDTIRVPLSTLNWNSELELHEGQLNSSVRESIVKQSDSGNCCLSDEHIIGLSNLLLALRRLSQVKDREIEWGITEQSSSNSSSSSSSGSSAANFHIHLLQSRPLTHLHKLNAHEIDHELDYGFSASMDIVTRANLGEVMPGASSPLNTTFFQPIVASLNPVKPYEKHHTQSPFVADTFAFYGQMAVMILTYSDSVNRFIHMNAPDAELKRAMIDSMIGTAMGNFGDDEKRKLFYAERINPNSKARKVNLPIILALDSKLADVIYEYKNKQAETQVLEDDLQPIEKLIEQMERKSGQLSLKDHQSTEQLIRADIMKLFDRICSDTTIIERGWLTHIRCTLLSMSLNTICLKILSEQQAYPDNQLNSAEVLNDFSILMQGEKKDEPSSRKQRENESTESGDISKLLQILTETLEEEGELEKAKSMDHKQLYKFLNESNQNKSGKLFREFMQKNGHRAYKEFDFATLTWADDPSYIMRSLALRIKQCTVEEIAKVREQTKERNKLQTEKVNEILAKVDKAKMILTAYALPRARNAVIRRERSKSFIIKMIHRYRKAFRHLGALLCLIGRLPNANMVYWLTIEELNQVICSNSSCDLSRFLFKARRRQQRSRSYDQVTFARPTMEFSEMVELIRSVNIKSPTKVSATEESETTNCNEEQSGHKIMVKGLTSCGGCVTGRACVVESIEDMERIEPNDILITYSIDISWSVYFFTLSGIVTEVGGIVSHGAVVAREYGIPTLCTAVGACIKFKTGQIVTLNADQGICYLAEETDIQQDG